MTPRCAPASMKAFIAASDVHTVRVQYVFCGCRRTDTATFPSADFACCAERNDPIRNIGKNRHDRTRNRVTETKAIPIS